MRGKSFYFKSFFFLIVLVCGCNFTASAQKYPFDAKKDALGKAIFDAGLFSSDLAKSIQDIPNNGRPQRIALLVDDYNVPPTSKDITGTGDKTGQEVRDACVMGYTFDLWRDGKLQAHPDILQKFTKSMGFTETELKDFKNEKLQEKIWDKIEPQYRIYVGYDTYYKNDPYN